jgi:hypothetical protein
LLSGAVICFSVRVGPGARSTRGTTTQVSTPTITSSTA